MTSSLCYWFKKVDLFGRSLSFEEHNVQSFKTYIGASLSIFTFITVTTVGFLFGKEIYERNVPIVMNSEEQVELSKVHLSDFPLMLFFRDGNYKDFRNVSSLLRIESNVFDVHYNRTLTMRNFVGLTECIPERFTKHQDFVREMLTEATFTNSTAYCLNYEDDLIVQNPSLTPNSKLLHLYIRLCSREANTIEYRNFKPQGECDPLAKEKTQVVLLTMNYMNSFFNPKNYSNPVVYYKDNNIQTLGHGLGVNLDFRLQRNMFFSDTGWILEEKQEEEAISVTHNRYLLQSSTELMFSMMIDVNNFLKRTERTYLKVQELFAKIGGLFNAMSIICHVLLYDYTRFKYRVHFSRFALGLTDQDSSSNSAINLNSNDLYKEIQTSSKTINTSDKADNNKQNHQPALEGHVHYKAFSSNKLHQISLQQTNPISTLFKDIKAKEKAERSSCILSKNPIIKLENHNNHAFRKIPCPDMIMSGTALKAYEGKDSHRLVEEGDSDKQEACCLDCNNYRSCNLAIIREVSHSNLKENKTEVLHTAPDPDKLPESPQLNKQRKSSMSTISNMKCQKREGFEKGISPIQPSTLARIDALCYYTYAFHRLFFSCYSVNKGNPLVRLLTDEKTRHKYSFESYLSNIRKLISQENR